MTVKPNLTIRELARLAGVSIGTVSRALKGQPGPSASTRAEVLRVAEEHGYDLGRLRSGRPRRILLVYNRSLVGSLAANLFYSYVLHGVETACREGEEVVLSVLSVAPTDDIVARIKRHEPDGLISVGYFDTDCMDALRACELPMVLADHYLPGLRCVNDDNLQGALMATKHLIDGGAKRVAAIFGPPVHHSIALRAKGFRRALFEARILADPELEITLDPELPYDEAAREAMRRLLALPERPDAVFAYNDLTALHAMDTCREAGIRVPEDIRFVGYDDIEAASHSEPSLTTVKLDKESLGYTAAMALIEGDTEPGDTLLTVELVVRSSSKPEQARAAVDVVKLPEAVPAG